MEKKRYVVGLGEILWDVLPDGRQLGGAPSNFAYHAGQFLGTDNTLAISALGDDPLADETIASLREHGLNEIMPRVSYPTGTVEVTLDEHGIPSYDIKDDVAWDNIPYSYEICLVAQSCRAVCFGSLAQRSAVSRSTIHRFLDDTPADCLKIFDINLRQHFYTVEIIEQSLCRCNVLKINDEELAVIGPMLCGEQIGNDGVIGLDMEDTCRLIISKYGIDMLVLTCGTNGSYVFSRAAADRQTLDQAHQVSSHEELSVSFLETPKVEVADTVGAGDSFTGSFCAAILSGMPVAEAHRLAVEVSAYVCSQHGAMPEYPVGLALKSR